MDIGDIINKISYGMASLSRDENNRGKHVNQAGWKTKEQMQREATAIKIGLTVFVLALFAAFAVIALLVKGLFSKNKYVKVISAVGLVAIAAGTVVIVRMAMDSASKARKTAKGEICRSRLPVSPMDGYLEMEEAPFRKECETIFDPVRLPALTPDVRTNLVAVLLFRDRLLDMGVTVEAVKASCVSGGFDVLHRPAVARRLSRHRESDAASGQAAGERPADGSYLPNVFAALDACCAQVDAPEWERQELKIRAGLDYYAADGEGVCKEIMAAAKMDTASMGMCMRYLEAREIGRILSQAGRPGLIGFDGIKLDADRGALSCSQDCSRLIVKNCGFCGIAAKWVRKLGIWCLAREARGGIAFSASPGFPCDQIVVASGRSAACNVDFARPVCLLRKDMKVEMLPAGSHSIKGILDACGLSRDRSKVKVKCFTPSGAVEISTGERPQEQEHAAPAAPKETGCGRAPSGRSGNAPEAVEERKAPSVASAEIAPDSPGNPTGGEKPQTLEPGARPRSVAAKTHDWQALCRREWRKTFPRIQETFARFGGFRLAQAPVDGIAMEGNRQTDVPLRSRYRYFQKADLKFSHGALVGFTLKVHFDKKYSMASVVNEGNATKRDVLGVLNGLRSPSTGVKVNFWRESLFANLQCATVEYASGRGDSVHGINGRVDVTCMLTEAQDGYELTLTVRDSGFGGISRFIEQHLRKEAFEAGEELAVFGRGKGAGRTAAARTGAVKIPGFRSWRFGQEYPGAQIPSGMRREGGFAIKEVPVSYGKFSALELWYAVEGKKLCKLKFSAEFPGDADDRAIKREIDRVKSDLERQIGFVMGEMDCEVCYEDENYIVKIWSRPEDKGVNRTSVVGGRRQSVAYTAHVKKLYLELEDKNQSRGK